MTKSKLITKPCDNCGNPVYKTPSRFERSKTHFCDRKCCAEYMSKGNHHAYKPEAHKKCEVCGVEMARARLQFCSVTCRSKAFSGEQHPTFRQLKLPCSHCGVEVIRTPATIKASNFCSEDCKNRYHSERMSGPLNPRYKDGIWKSGLTVKDMYPGLTLKLKKRVRARDNNSCQVCGITHEEYKSNMHVHHIDYDKTNNVVGNLICLCKHCHMKVHTNEPIWPEILLKKLKS